MAFLDYDGLEYFKGKIEESVAVQLAATYSASSAYKVGDYCTEDGALYRCTTPIASPGEAWTAGHWIAVSVSDVLASATGLTKNLAKFEKLWKGDGFVALYSSSPGFTEPLGAGTYTLSVLATSDNYNDDNIYIGVYKANTTQLINRLAFQAFAKTGGVIHYTFTVAEEIKSIYVWAANTTSGSSGYNVTIGAIQLERGSVFTPIIQHNDTANDFEAREEIENLKLGNPVKIYNNFTSGYIDTSGTSVTPLSPSASDSFCHAIVPCEAGDSFIVQTWGNNVGSALTWVFCDSSNNILARGPKMPNSLNAGRVMTYKYWNKVIAPVNAAYLVANHHNLTENGYTPKIYKMTGSDTGDYIASRVTGELPYKPINRWENEVVATYKNSIVINEDGVLKKSTDSGNTWSVGMSVSSLGAIVNYHLYADGTLGFFTARKAYYTTDFSSYTEAPCYEANGTSFVATDDYNFNSIVDHAERKFVNGVDLYVFGNYSTVSGSRALLWYSADNGHSYKIAYEFGVSGAYPARHIHDVIYYAAEDVFILGTGDNVTTECNVYSFVYNSESGTWSSEKLGGPSRDYKWACIGIYADEIYFCFDSTPGAIRKCKYADIGDTSKHEVVLSGTESDMIGLAFGNKTGELVAMQSFYRSTGGQTAPTGQTAYEACKIMYYSSDRKNWQKVIIPQNIINKVTPQYRVLPVLDDGRLFVGTGFDEMSRLPSLNVGDFLNTCGYRQAFKTF